MWRKNMLVRIEWKNPEHDWHWFYLIGVHGRRVLLKGATDQETGDKHDGDEFLAEIAEILELEYRPHR